MTIGLDARFLGEAGGLARYSQQLINHLAAIDTANRYAVFLRQNNYCEFDNIKRANFEKIAADARWYSLKEQFLIPWKIWQTKVDLMHFFHWNVPLLYRGKFIVTIHDLILLKYPSKKATALSPLFFAIKYWMYKKVLRHAIYDSLKIIAPSQFVKNNILAHFKVPPDKIAVIYEGAGLSSQNNNRTAEQLNNLLSKPYLLYVGVAYPHKNLEGLIEAFKIFHEKYSNNYQLVLVGKENYFYKKLKQNLQSSIFNLPIIFTDFVPDSQLPQIYQNASLYIFPSLEEGFGLPALEAMRYGLPVIASDNSCLPEILGDAAAYFNPRDIEEMAETMQLVLSDTKLQEQLRQNGFERIKKYSWDDCARQTLLVYKQFLENKV